MSDIDEEDELLSKKYRSEVRAPKGWEGGLVTLSSKIKKKFLIRVPFTHEDDKLFTLVLGLVLVALGVALFLTIYHPHYIRSKNSHE